MKFIAHTENAAGNPHLLSDHLRGVGNLARDFAAAANPEMAEAAEWAGLLHDLGKYRDEFQEYIRQQREGGVDTHHAVYGAALAFDKDWVGPAFAIAGHHASLHDYDGLRTFVESEKYQATKRLEVLVERFASELGPVASGIAEPTELLGDRLSAEFYIRMLFSALVDADYLDTEQHHNCGEARGIISLNAPELLRLLAEGRDAKRIEAEKYIAPNDRGAKELNDLRNAIYEQCVNAGEKPQGFFSLTVPTGGGKTLSAMAFLLAHAARHQLRRVIVVIPYLSIIEQNAAEYRRILDPRDEGIVVENHSAVIVQAAEREEGNITEATARSPLELAAENWDAPIIVTTAVQFVESLFANKPSRCRKVHNIARSAVLFDEVQTLPAHLLNPLLSILRELHDSYGTSFVFSTATQPAFRRHFALTQGFTEDEVQKQEIIPDAPALFKKLRRVRFELPQPNETLDWLTLAAQMVERTQALCVVNLRRHAFELREELIAQLARNRCEDEAASVFHLSSAMCAEHRLFIIGTMHNPREGSIRWRLNNNLACRVVSTQLIEAGVDLDFPLVYRALAPLDSIVQAAGRCNREARQPELGRVVVFRLAEHTLPPGTYQTATQITEGLLRTTSDEDLATDPAIFADYFTQLYTATPTDYSRPGEASLQQERHEWNFRQVARKARVIEDSGIGVIVPYEAVGKSSIKLIGEIQNRPRSKDRARFDRQDLRSLQRFMVNLRHHDFQALLSPSRGQLKPLLPNLDLYVLSPGSYDERVGVVIDKRPTDDFVQ